MLRTLSFALLSASLLASPAIAQTTPTTSKPATRMVPSTSPAARKADPLRKSRNNGKGQNNYAAPGEPIIPARDNGKNTPSYDGPATGHGGGATHTTLATPK